MKRRYADTPEGQIHYRTDGAGDPILLLHSTPMSSEQYTDLMLILATDFLVLAMDNPGYGNSYTTSSSYAIKDYARSVVHFLDSLNIQRTNVIGTFTGSSIAVEFAASYPKRIDKLILTGVSMRNPEQRDKVLASPEFADLKLGDGNEFLNKQIQDFFLTPLEYVNKETAFKMFTASLLASERLNDGHYASFRYDKRSRLPLIKNPTLVVSGDKDMFVESIEAVRSLVPNCQIKVIEGGGFSVAYQKPREFAEAVLNFLRLSEI